ncbi:hypothetical protein GGH14_005004 [Coemansia sp. RSA 370]|nr:hypothetical protein GGH14_005004 [Coemansia sp. RSA 370]
MDTQSSNAVQYPLDRLHYAMFQLLLAITIPVLAVVMRWPGSEYRLEFTQGSPQPAVLPQSQPDAESLANSHAAVDAQGQRAAHKYVEQCADIERTFMQMATSEDSGASPWTMLTSLDRPYPISVQGHTAKPFCFRIVFYAPTSPGTAFDLLANILRRPEWDELTESTRIIEHLGPGDAIHYIKAKPVWPTSARDSLLLSHLAAVQVNGARAYLNVSKSIVDDRVPEISDLVRMEAGIAGQLITRVTEEERRAMGLAGEHWCKVVQIADGDLKGWIPKSVIKFIATQALPRSLKKVCQQLAVLPPSSESAILRPATALSGDASTDLIKTTSSDVINPILAKPHVPILRRNAVPARSRWTMWLRVLMRYATPAVVAAITTLVFQMILGRRAARRMS